MTSPVTLVAPATSENALAHFEKRLSYEADCWDTHEAMANDKQDFVLLDVRSPSLLQTQPYSGSHKSSARGK